MLHLLIPINSFPYLNMFCEECQEATMHIAHFRAYHAKQHTISFFCACETCLANNHGRIEGLKGYIFSHSIKHWRKHFEVVSDREN